MLVDFRTIIWYATSMPRKITQLQELASQMVGDGKSPNLFFVTDCSVVVTVTRCFETAYRHWNQLANRFYDERVECSLEDRRYGTICTVEPETENSTKLVAIDSSREFLKLYG